MIKNLFTMVFMATIVSAGTNDCSTPNPNGVYNDGAWLTMNEEMVSVVQAVPNHFGMVMYGSITMPQVPFGYGHLCLAPNAPNFSRGDMKFFDDFGQAHFVSPPIFPAPLNNYAQVLYRDVDGQLNTTNIIPVLPMVL